MALLSVKDPHPGLVSQNKEVKMAVQSDGSGRDEIKTQFFTREGAYKQVSLAEYSRPNRVGYNTQSNTPVKVSFVTLPDQSGNNVRICFNIGRELYTYVYKGIKKVIVYNLL